MTNAKFDEMVSLLQSVRHQIDSVSRVFRKFDDELLFVDSDIRLKVDSSVAELTNAVSCLAEVVFGFALIEEEDYR